MVGFNVESIFTSDSLYNKKNLYVKHTIDFLTAACTLPFITLPIAIISLAIFVENLIHRESRGPVFITEPRLTEGALFNLYKFRSFYIQDDSKNEHLRGTTDFINKRRTTIVGSFLRKFYLDELPQIINILKGEMSIVGPRPWPENQYNAYLEAGFHGKRLARAGLCGPVQGLKGMKEKQRECVSDPEEQLVRDYLNASAFGVILIDWTHIISTLKIVLRAEGL